MTDDLDQKYAVLQEAFFDYARSAKDSIRDLEAIIAAKDALAAHDHAEMASMRREIEYWHRKVRELAEAPIGKRIFDENLKQKIHDHFTKEEKNA